MKRVIDGYNYHLTTTHKDKLVAKRHATSLRNKGFRSRVIKLSDVYGVYFTPAKKKKR